MALNKRTAMSSRKQRAEGREDRLRVLGLTGVCMGFSCRGMAGDLQVGLGFGPGFGQQPYPAPEPSPVRQSPQPGDAVPDYADGPSRLLPATAVRGRQRLGRRSQAARGHRRLPLRSHRPGSGASPPATRTNAAKSAPGQSCGSSAIANPGS